MSHICDMGLHEQLFFYINWNNKNKINQHVIKIKKCNPYNIKKIHQN
jgi:hypothetical protein